MISEGEGVVALEPAGVCVETPGGGADEATMDSSEQLTC